MGFIIGVVVGVAVGIIISMKIPRKPTRCCGTCEWVGSTSGYDNVHSCYNTDFRVALLANIF